MRERGVLWCPSGPEGPQLSIRSVILSDMDTVLSLGLRMQSAES